MSKQERLERTIREMLHILELDHLTETPVQMAKMYLHELFTQDHEPKVTYLSETTRVHVQLEAIPFVSFCAHHLLPFHGKASISYTPKEQMWGLSSFHRVVHHFARRPQLQENMTEQIFDFMQHKLAPSELEIKIEAKHDCVAARGSSSGVVVTSLTQ